ncbi:MotB family protein [Rhodobacterales bacterium]|nr:MotB family protein [Rhodobacterales bacterium]
MIDGLSNEIVIVRRRNSWEEDLPAHGVWKIAYADFMTALMAFFLVMWLINVTDDSVRRGVAQYFNPVKLASTAPNRKGLNDPEVNGETSENGTKLFKGALGGTDAPSQEEQDFGDGLKESSLSPRPGDDGSNGAGRTMPGQFTQIHAESILFSDPYAVLDTLSEQIRVSETLEDNPQGIGSGMQKEPGNQGGQAYRDPFDPMFWQFRPGRGVDSAALPKEEPRESGDGYGPSDRQLEGDFAWGAPMIENEFQQAGQVEETVPADADRTGPMDPGLLEGGKPLEASGELEQAINSEGSASEALPPRVKPVVAHVTGKMETQVKLSAAVPAEEGFEVLQSSATEGELAESEGTDGEAASGTEKLVAQVTEVLESTKGTVLEATAAQISVTRDGVGALISLTDDQDFGMFAIGSAEPRPELVKLLERIGKVVAESPGQIVIKGHTDARPFRSKNYDNWRLSSARAHMALYMLSRGGVEKTRFDRVEGYADRHLKTPADPYAANNRRIEIYLLEGNS